MVLVDIYCKITNNSNETKDGNVNFSVSNGVLGSVYGFVIWDMEPGMWVQWGLTWDVDWPAGDYIGTATAYETVTPGNKIYDVIIDDVKYGEAYDQFTSTNNALDSKDVSFTIPVLGEMEISNVHFDVTI